MFNRFLLLPLAKKGALIAASLSFMVCVILLLASHQSSRVIITQSAQMLGENLAAQLARDASNALVQGDKLSLKALLNNFIKSPIVAHGAIYDATNRAIVEAGNPHTTTASRAFSASITFQDSLAGYAIIIIDSGPLTKSAQSQFLQLFALGLLLTVLSYALGLIPARHLAAAINDLSALAGKPTSQRTGNIHLAYRGRDELQRLAHQIISGADSIAEGDASEINPAKADSPLDLPQSKYAALYIEINNLRAVEQQRTPRDVDRLISQCHRYLETICKLYDGILTLESSNGFSVTFLPGKQQDYPFRALCAAYLMARQFHRTPLQVRVGVTLCDTLQSADEEESPARLLRWQLDHRRHIELTRNICEKGNATEGNLLASIKLLNHSSVAECVEHRDIDSQYAAIEQLREPYKTLLNKQLERI